MPEGEPPGFPPDGPPPWDLKIYGHVPERLVCEVSLRQACAGGGAPPFVLMKNFKQYLRFSYENPMNSYYFLLFLMISY